MVSLQESELSKLETLPSMKAKKHKESKSKKKVKDGGLQNCKEKSNEQVQQSSPTLGRRLRNVLGAVRFLGRRHSRNSRGSIDAKKGSEPATHPAPSRRLSDRVASDSSRPSSNKVSITTKFFRDWSQPQPPQQPRRSASSSSPAQPKPSGNRLNRNLPQYHSERHHNHPHHGSITSQDKVRDSPHTNKTANDSTKERGSHSFLNRRRFSYHENTTTSANIISNNNLNNSDTSSILQETRQSLQNVASTTTTIGRSQHHEEVKMVTQDTSSQQAKAPAEDKGEPENIYENVAREPPSPISPCPAVGEEPPPPPQPPYTCDEPRVRLERDRERRSIRKLTKDSGYETSQYAESDYANLDWDSEHAGSEVASASDRSPTARSSTRSPSTDVWGGSERDGGSPHASSVGSSSGGGYGDRYPCPTDPWRTGQAYWGSQPQHVGGKSSHRSSSYPSKSRDPWALCNYHSSRHRDYSSSDEKATSPPPYGSLHFHPHHRKTSSYNISSHAGDSGHDQRHLGRHSSTDSLTSGSSSVFSYPLASVSSAKSTPSLSRDAEVEPRRPLAPHQGPSSPGAISSSRSTPNLEQDIMPHPYWEDHESRDEYEAQLRSAAAAFQAQHSRQVSSQSSGSERTSSSSAYSHSVHSRQVSSQSSFSEEDFRIQSIKEEFLQRTSNQDYYVNYGNGNAKDGSYGLPQYSPQKFYSSDNLISSYVDERDVELRKAPHFTWAKSQPDLKGISQVDGKIVSSLSPPPPPVRDASSLKYSGRFASGHEKFPSWPITMNQSSEDLDIMSDSEKPEKPVYNRGRKMSSGYTQYLKTVVENPFDKRRDKNYDIPPPVYVSSHNDVNYNNCKGYYSQSGSYYVPHYDQDGRSCVDSDSGSVRNTLDERRNSAATETLDDDAPPPPYSPPRSNSIVSTGAANQSYDSESHMERNGWISESKAQPQVAYTKHTSSKSEDNENKAASCDNHSSTPFMDRLRRESQQSLWTNAEDGTQGNSPPTGRESVTSSNSSQETLKWHGSTSDVSVVSERTRSGYSVENIVHSARVQPPQRHHSESVLYYSSDQLKKECNQPSLCNGIGEQNDSTNSLNRLSNNQNNKSNCFNESASGIPWRTKGAKENSPPYTWADQVQKNNFLNSTSPRRMTAYTATSFVSSFGHGEERRAESLAREEFRSLPSPEYAKPLSVAKRVQDIERQARNNTGLTNSVRTRGPSSTERRNDKDMIIASPTFPGGKVKMSTKPGAGSSSTGSSSAAECEIIHHSPSSDKLLYLDPEKKHRVSDPELKAIQKQAVLSFFERQTGINSQQHQSLNRSPMSKESYAAKRPHSLPRDCYQDFKNHSQMYSRMDRVPEVDADFSSNTLSSSPSSSSCGSSSDFKDEIACQPAKSQSMDLLDLHDTNSSDNNSHPSTPQKTIAGSLGRRTDSGSSRVALYYNTYTQTLPWSEGDACPQTLRDGPSCGSSPVKILDGYGIPHSPYKDRISGSPRSELHQHRKDIGLQTDCSIPPNVTRSSSSDNNHQNKQPKLTSSPAKSDDQKEVENVNNSISNHLLSRFMSPLTKTHTDESPNNNNNNLNRNSSNSNHNKKNASLFKSSLPAELPPSTQLANVNRPSQGSVSLADKRSADLGELQSRIPPERPPKRPHLRPRSSSPPPPPLLPRAQPRHHNIILNCTSAINNNNNRNSNGNSSNSGSDADEDLELKKIEESAEELRRLNNRHNNLNSACTSPVSLEESRRSPTPDLPLPPPPPRSDDDEEEVLCPDDQPLPPPPTHVEVCHLLQTIEGQPQQQAEPQHQQQQSLTGNTNSRSPPISYPKNSYMTYRNEKHPGRFGFDGNYHRMSPVNKSEEITKEDKQEMESVATSLTPSAWERWHNIGRPSATVVFNSQALKPSGSLRDMSNQTHQRTNSTSSNHSDIVNGGAKIPVKFARRNLHAEIGRDGSNGGLIVSKPISSSSFSYGDSQNRSLSDHGNLDETSSVIYKSPVNRLGAQKGCWASLDSLTPQQPKSSSQCSRESSASWPSSNRHPSVSQSLVHSSHSSLKINDSETQTTDILNCSNLQQDRSYQMTVDDRPRIESSSDSQNSHAKPTLRDQRKNSSTQTALEHQLLRHVEVMTQTTPSVAKNERLRRKEVIECDQLTKALASQLPEEDRALQVLLVPTQLKTTADYMEGLFEMESSRHTPQKQVCSRGTGEKIENASPEETKRSPEAAPLPADSAYFTTSESKAKFLNRYNKDVNKPLMVDIKDTADLAKRKEDLIESISRKLDILRAEQLAIHEEIQANQELGASVTQWVEKMAKPNELEKYKQHIEKTEMITNLLLSLSGRLARAENALMGLGDQANQEERQTLEAKRDDLFQQHEEAKKLKEDIDRRSLRVSDFLTKYLSEDEYADYDHFIKMKSKLLIDSREIDEKIKLGEEQMSSLKESLEKKL